MELSTKLSITSDGAVMGFFLLRFGAFFEDKIVYVPSVCKIIHAFIWVAQRGIDNSAILLYKVIQLLLKMKILELMTEQRLLSVCKIIHAFIWVA